MVVPSHPVKEVSGRLGRHRQQPWSELDEHDRASLTVDCILLTVAGTQLEVLLHERRHAPQVGHWALPGAFVAFREREADAVRRALKDKAGLSLDIDPIPLIWAGEPDRDERGWVVTHIYMATAPVHELRRHLDGERGLFAPVFLPPGYHPEPYAHVPVPGTAGTELAFDHNQLIAQAVVRLRQQIRSTSALLGLMSERFTMHELQTAFEAVTAERLSRASFQRLVLGELKIVEPTDEWEPLGTGRRRAQYYQAR